MAGELGQTDKTFIEAAMQFGGKVTVLSDDHARQVRYQVANAFVGDHWTDDRKMNWRGLFYDGTHDYVTRVDHEAWQWIHDMIADHTIFFISGSGFIFEIEKGETISKILARVWQDVSIHEFYITNTDIEYVLAYEDSERLYALGTAKEWLKEFPMRDMFTLLNRPAKPISVLDVITENWGLRIILRCNYDPDGDNQPFEIIFEPTYSIEWDTYGYKSSEGKPRLGLFHHFRHRGREGVTISTRVFRLKFVYDGLTLHGI